MSNRALTAEEFGAIIERMLRHMEAELEEIMAGKGREPSPYSREKGESYCNANQRLPKGNFDSNGVSQGQRDGACRPTADAYQGPRSEGESTPAKPAN